MNNTSTPVHYLQPAASIVENADGFIIEADMPGVTKDGVELTVDQETLIIAGKRNAARVGGRSLHRESTGADYRRAFELGREIDRQRVEARLDQGVLRVFLPKLEEIKPRRVEIAG